MCGEAMLVDVHDEELTELHVLVPLERHAVAGPAQPLQVDAETLRQLRSKTPPCHKGGQRGKEGCSEQHGTCPEERRGQPKGPS